MPHFNVGELIAQRRSEKFSLHERFLNTQLVRVLKTIGFDREYVRGEGQYLYDAEGARYLDLLSGFGVFALGRNHPVVKQALADVLAADLPNLVQIDVSVLSGVLAERLLRRMPGLEKMFFCNSGAEAVEAAIKFARYATGRAKIVHCDHSYHGLTYGALSVGGGEEFRAGFGPLLPDCVSVPFNDLAALEAAIKDRDAAAFIVEPIQGKGVNMPDDGYLSEAARLCRKHGTLFVADEVQTGVGRTGRFLAIDHWNVDADMVLLAKALSGGHVPIGAVALKRWIFDRVFDRMDRAVVHGSTFSKTDLAMAAALATLAVLDDERLVEAAAEKGADLMADLGALKATHPEIAAVRGKGLMIGIELGVPENVGGKVAWRLLDQIEQGLCCQMIVGPLFARHRIISQVAGHRMPVIKLLPPYVITAEDRAWIRRGFDDVLSDCRNVTRSVLPFLYNLGVGAMKAG